MGFTKKSLLALVLALVMVLGMAMPTAFAAVTTKGMAIFEASARADNTNIAPDGDGKVVVTMDADVGSKTLYLSSYDASAAAGRVDIGASGTFSGDAATIQILNLDTDYLTITTDGSDGSVTMKPTGKIAVGTYSFTIRATAPDSEWKAKNGGTKIGDVVYEQEIYYVVHPTITYVGAPIVFDMTDPSKQTVVLQGNMFTSSSGAAVALQDGLTVDNPAPVPAAATISALATGDTSDRGYQLTRTATTIGSGTIVVKANVSGVPARDLSIPYIVGNSVEPTGYKVGTDKAELKFKPNSDIDVRTLNAFVADANGNRVTSSTLTITGVSLSNQTLVRTAGAESLVAANTGNSVRVAADAGKTIISGTATLTITGKTSGGTALVRAEIPVTVEALNLTIDATSLVFDVDQTADPKKNTQIIKLSSTDNGVLVKTLPTISAPLDAWFATTATDYQYLGTAPLTTAVTSGTASIYSMIDGYQTETVKIPYSVVNNTPKPKYQPDVTTLNFDVRNAPAKQVVNFTVDNTWTDASISSYTLTDMNGKTATLASYLKTPTVDASKKKITFEAVGPTFEGDLTIKGTCALSTYDQQVPNVAFEPVKLHVVITNTQPDTVHHIAPISAITGVQGDVPQIIVDVQDFQNNSVTALKSKITDWQLLDTDGNAVTTATYLGITQVEQTNKYNVVFKLPFTGTLKIWAWKTSKAADGVYYDVPVTIKGLTLTPDITSKLVFDRANGEDKKKITITLPGATGFDSVAVGSWSTNPVSGGLVVGSLTPVAAESTPTKKVYEIKLNTGAVGSTNPNKLDAGKLMFKGAKISGISVDDLVFDYQIVNTISLVPDKTEIKFSMATGGTKETVLTITPKPNGGTAAGVTVKAVDTSIVSVTKQLADPLKFDLKALKPGTTLVTIDGMVNGVVVPQATVTVIVEGDELPVLVVTPNPIALDLTTNKEVTLAVTSSVAGKTVTDAKITYTGALVTVDGLKVTAALAGTGSLTVDGKIDGIAAATVTVPITVTEAPVITGDFLVNGAPGTAGSLFVRNSVANNQYKLTLNGYTGSVTWKISNKSILKFIDAPAGKASSTKTGTEVQWVQVLKAGTVKVTATPATGTAKSISFTIKAEAETGFTVGDQALLVGQRASAKPEIVPATAKTKGFKFKSSDKKVVTVSSKGILVAKKAGTATITVTPKKKGLAKQTFTVTVTVDYKNLNYNSVVLLQNSDGKPNADADNVKKIFESARFDASGNAAGANILAATATKADVKAAIATMALASKNTSDISNFYFAGAATKTGLTFTDGEYSYTDLANDLAKCTGNVVVFLDCTGGNRLINAKAASDADIFAAFSKAVKPGLSTMTNSAVEKLSFTVFTSTAKAKTTVTPTVSADGSSVQYKFTKLFAETLKVSDSNTISVGTNGIVNVKQLWAKLKAAKGSVWASKKSVMPIYGYVPAAPVTP